MALLSVQEVVVGYGGPLLLDGVNLQVQEGERIALLGRNGSGKTTLLKIMNGDFLPDEGNVTRKQGVVTALLTQEVPGDMEGKVYDIITSGLGKMKETLSQYHQVSSRLAENPGTDEETLLTQLDRLQQSLDAEDGWQIQRRVDDVIARLTLQPDASFSSLSAGMKRRVLLARALVSRPDVLLLDEPTNHMDINTITQLEELFADYEGTLVLVTHDRQLVQKLATRIIELDRGKLFSWACDYRAYLQRKAALLEAEEEEWARFDKKLAKEETWIRQGIKARRKRDQGRLQKLLKMREIRRERREQIGNVRMKLQEAKRSGKIVIEAEDVSFSYPGHPEKLLVRDFTCSIMRGDRVGIIGPNGSGKTTLLRLLLDELTPISGSVSAGTHLKPAYFDQLRAQLDDTQTVRENVAVGNDFILVNGERRHVIGYLQEFLFTPERARTKVEVLSGGERNRLLLARLFTQPTNLLVLDEPTNDLDIETLELLEELLMEFNGTLLLVSHDRAFLNNVVTSTLVLEGDGVVNEYIGGYDDWQRQAAANRTAAKKEQEKTKEKETNQQEKDRRKAIRTRKLSFNEERELAALPQRIESLEEEQEQLFQDMSDPAFFTAEGEKIAQAKDRLEQIKQELQAAYERWEILEAIKSGQA